MDVMPRERNRIEWPKWATVALLVVMITSIATVAATLNDI